MVSRGIEVSICVYIYTNMYDMCVCMSTYISSNFDLEPLQELAAPSPALSPRRPMVAAEGADSNSLCPGLSNRVDRSPLRLIIRAYLRGPRDGSLQPVECVGASGLL